MNTLAQLSLDPEGDPANPTAYTGIIGSLLYLTASQPNISFAVGLCARFQGNPKKSHMDAAVGIVRYLKGMETLGIWYQRDDSPELRRYSDFIFGGCRIDWKRTSGTC